MKFENLQNIFESLDPNTKDSYFEYWQQEIHPTLMEVALAPDQINQLFKNVEQSVTAQGSNRTLAGKAVDTAGKISNKVTDVWFNKLGGALQNSEPVKNFDAKWEDIKSKFATKHPDIAEKLAKYGEYSKNNPKTHKFLLAIAGSMAAALGLAAVGGLSAGITATGLGVGGATAIINIADRLLKGQKASTAVGRGATAGAVAGLTAAGVKAAADALNQLGAITKIKNSYYVNFNGKGAYLNAEDFRAWREGMQSANDMTKGIDFMSNSDAYFSAVDAGMTKSAEVAAELLSKAADPAYQKAAMDAAEIVIKPGAVESAVAAMRDAAKIVNPVISAAAGQAAAGANESYYVNTRPLSEGQVYMIFNSVCQHTNTLLSEGVLKEGPLGWIKQKANTISANLTTKITADKLNSAWSKAGSPTDSNQLADFLKTQGVNDTVIAQTYKAMKLPPPGTQPPKTMTYQELAAEVAKHRPRDRRLLIAALQKQLGIATP